MNNKQITFEINKDKDQLDIHLDGNGIDYLMKIFDELRTKNVDDHFHLRTPEWGGDQLSAEKQSESSEIMNSVTIHFWQR